MRALSFRLSDDTLFQLDSIKDYMSRERHGHVSATEALGWAVAQAKQRVEQLEQAKTPGLARLAKILAARVLLDEIAGEIRAKEIEAVRSAARKSGSTPAQQMMLHMPGAIEREIDREVEKLSRFPSKQD